MSSKPKRRVSDLFTTLNKWCGEFKPLIETVGILAGLLLLIFTLWSTLISRDLLFLSKEQEINKQNPIWDFQVIDSLDIVRIKPFNSDIKIQKADAYFSKQILGSNNEWPLDQPNFDLHLTILKYQIAEILKKKVEPKQEYYQISFRNTVPVGIEINYLQFGEVRKVFGLFAIEFIMVRDSDLDPEIKINGVLFDSYQHEDNLKSIVEKVTRVSIGL